MKDNFSADSAAYKQYRPVYPQELYDYLATLPATAGTLWDCGTGNGQLAYGLAPYFRQVIATDISVQQLDQAPVADNVSYRQEPAEHTSIADGIVDIVTVAQALHWFNFDAFYAELRRVIKPGGLFVAITYNLMQCEPETDAIVQDFYHNVTGPYWDAERRYIDENYQTIPFPFHELPAPALRMRMQWSLEQLTGYLRTWSAVKHYIAANATDPVQQVEAQLRRTWNGKETREVSFPLILRVGVL